MIDSIEFDQDELDAATSWHGGQSSMLYAISSTGSLKRGTERCRPRVDCDACGQFSYRGTWCTTCHGAKMTDAQWLAYLARKLESEAEECAEHARERIGASHEEDEPGEMECHVAAFDSIVAKCRAAIIALEGAR